MDAKYKRMLAVMQEKEKALPPSDEKWYLYILKCKDGSFYTGVTNDLDRRLKMHNAGRASRFTRVRLPVERVYEEFCGSRTAALVRECAVKAFPRKKKDLLVASFRPKKKRTRKKTDAGNTGRKTAKI